MELFGSRLSSNFKQIIPNCVPFSHQIYLQTRIKGGDHVYSLSSKTVIQINLNDIRVWRGQESKHLDAFTKHFDSEGSSSLLTIRKNFCVCELSDGSGKLAILFTSPNDKPFNLEAISKWQISRCGKLSGCVPRSDGSFKILMK
jgi:hypothetical protein